MTRGETHSDELRLRLEEPLPKELGGYGQSGESGGEGLLVGGDGMQDGGRRKVGGVYGVLLSGPRKPVDGGSRQVGSSKFLSWAMGD